LNNQNTINLLREGDQVVFRLVYDEYHVRVYSYVHKKTGSDFLAEEVMQLTCIKLWKFRQSLNPELSLFTQVFRITTTTMIDLIRAEERKRHSLEGLRRRPAATADPCESVEENELRKRVTSLVRRMPDMQKKVFEMSRFEEKSHREIATALSISIKTVETHISRALKFLRQNLTSWFL